MKKFDIVMILEITKNESGKYELMGDYQFEYYEEKAELGKYFIQENKDVEFLEFFDLDIALEFENRKDVYDYIFIKTEELLKLGVEICILEKH